MDTLCEMMKLYVATGNIEQVYFVGGGSAYAIYRKASGAGKNRTPATHLFLSYCPGCGTPQNLDKEKGPVGLFCTLAGVPLRYPEEPSSATT